MKKESFLRQLKHLIYGLLVADTDADLTNTPQTPRKHQTQYNNPHTTHTHWY